MAKEPNVPMLTARRIGRVMVVALFLGGVAEPARASVAADGGTSCASGRVVVEGELATEWTLELDHVCEALTTARNVDPSVRVRVRAAGPELEIDATLSDGRTAHRRVQLPRDLRLTIEALVSLPASLPPPAPDPAPARPPSPSPPARATPEKGQAATSVGIELSAAVTGRYSGKPGYVSAGLEGNAALAVGHFVLGLVARWDAWQVPTRMSSASFEMDTVGVGFAVARRARLSENLRVDAGVTTMLVTESQSIQRGEFERAGTATDARLGLIGRAHLGTGALRGMLVLESEVSPSRVRRTIRIDDQLPALPAWSIALGAGVSWGEP
jgi:hypothetical protein